MAVPFAMLYRKLARGFTVYSFSRGNTLAPGTTTREMAAELCEAMDLLGLSGAAVVGVSQGGMIAEWLAIDHPEKVRCLVLTVTTARPNPTLQGCIDRWSEMARRGDYQGIMLDTAERSYSPKRVRQARLTYRLLGNVGKPESFERFLIEAQSCLTHDAAEQLQRISCPTLVIGGTDDRIATGQASEETAGMIPGAQLYMYDGLGHGLYEEAKDFESRVAAFCGNAR
jgi:pimeloyl-ACP methyl ester carboxylesterase